jgi:hypothetical protein
LEVGHQRTNPEARESTIASETLSPENSKTVGDLEEARCAWALPSQATRIAFVEWKKQALLNSAQCRPKVQR